MHKKSYKKHSLLAAKVVKALIQSIKSTYEAECKEMGIKTKRPVGEYYGFDMKGKKIHSLQKSMKEDKKKKENNWEKWEKEKEKIIRETENINYMAVTETIEPIRYSNADKEMEIPPRYLYDTYREAEKSNNYKSIQFNETYLRLSLKYIGYNDLIEFLNAEFGEGSTDTQFQINLTNNIKDATSPKAVTFKGYHFTNETELHRDDFLIKMDFKLDKNNFDVEVKNFHKNHQGNRGDKDSSIIYTGKARANEDSSYIYMSLTSGNRPMNIFCHKNLSMLDNIKWMLAIVSGIGSDGVPFAFETILVRNDSWAGNEEYIDAYLQMRRSHIKLPQQVISHPKKLESPITRTAAGELTKLIGTYRVWNFLWREELGIMQSKLIIHDNFKCDIENAYYVTPTGKEEDRKKQHCVLSISHVRGGRRKLCIASHTPVDDGMEVINYGILDIEGLKKEKLSVGVFCGQRGYRKNEKDTGLAAEPLVFIKDESEFEAGMLGLEDIKKLIQIKDKDKDKDKDKYPYETMLSKLFEAYGVRKNNKSELDFIVEDVPEQVRRVKFMNNLHSLFNKTLRPE